MADEIRQKMGFDVSEALTNLSALRDALGQTSTSLSSLAKAGGGISKLGQTTNSSLGSATTAVNKFGSQTAAAAQQATPAVNSLTVSFETLSRVVATQFVVRTLSLLRNALKESISDFIEFQTAIAEIETIANGESFDQLAKTVLEVSNNFNIPVIEAARGAYEAYSNQVIKSANDTKFLSDAAAFAVATQTSFSKSIDLLSTSLNAYGKTTEETDALASQFFETIKLGKVRGEELGAAFGRVAPLASQLGVTTGELNAALAALTIGGVKASEAGTQLRGILASLLKPTDAMKAAFAELHIASPEQLIEAKGLLGALEALKGTTHGSTTEIAALFQNIRALTGTLRLGGKGLQTFADDQQRIIETSDRLAKQKAGDILAQSGQQVQLVWRKVANTFTTEVGPAFVDTADKALKFVGGADTIIALGTPLVTLFGEATIGIGALAASFGFARAQALLLNNTLGASQRSLVLFGQAAAAIEVGQFAGKAFGDLISAFKNKELQTLANNAAAAIDTEKETTKAIIAERQRQLDAAKRRDAEEVISMQAKADQEIAIVRASSDEQKDVLQTNLNVVLDAQKARVEKLKSTATDAKNAIEQSIARATDLKQGISDQKFAQNLVGLTDPQKFQRVLGNAATILSTAKKQFLASTDPKALDNAVGQFDRATNKAQDALNQAQASGDRQGQVAAEQLLLKIKRDQLKLEQQIQTTLKERQKEADVAASKEEARTKRLSEDAKDILKNFTTTDKNGNPLTEDQQAKVNAALTAAITKFNSDSSPADQIDLAKKLNVATLDKLIKDRLSTVEIQSITLADKAQEKLLSQIATLEIPVTLKIAENKENQDRAQEAINKLQDIGKTNAAALAIDGLTDSIVLLNDQIHRENPNNLIDKLAGFDVAKLQDIGNKLEFLARSGQLTQDTLNGLNASFLEAGGTFDGTGVDSPIAGALQFAQQLVEKQAAAAVQANTLKVNTDAVLPSVKALADQYERLNTAIQAAAGGAARLGPNTFGTRQVDQVLKQRAGGLARFLATGGFAGRGTDSIHAMLSPGEFVVNARSSSRFFSQLQSINAGREPVMRSQGGPITNVTIGDVNVQGGATPSKTGRAIASELRREIRRGSIHGFN